MRWAKIKEPDYVVVGEQIKAFQQRRGMSQEQLAERAGGPKHI